jgi:peroxiredoxin Q/BCP
VVPSTSGGGRRIPCNHTPGSSNLPSGRANPTVRGETRNTLMVDLRKATKGRRMSKKTRKKSSGQPQSRKTPARNHPRPRLHPKAHCRSDTTSAKKACRASPASRPNQSPRGPSKHRPKPLRPKASHKPPSKPLKSNLSAPPKPVPEPNWSRARDSLPSVCPRDGGGNVSLAD